MNNEFQYLIEVLSKEIQIYRQRQLTTFREVIIVQALITWGISQLGLEKLQSQDIISIIRFCAAIGCIVAGVVGVLIIMAYKKRIYYIREKRNILGIKWQEKFIPTSSLGELFYPTDIKVIPTSTIYIVTVIVFSLLTSLVNFLIGLVR